MFSAYTVDEHGLVGQWQLDTDTFEGYQLDSYSPLQFDIIENRDVFINSFGTLSPQNLVMRRVSFTDSTVDKWCRRINSVLNPITRSFSNTYVDTDAIYTFTVFEGLALFITVRVSDGSVIGTRYQSTSGTAAYQIEKESNLVYLLYTKLSVFSLAIYNVDEDTFNSFSIQNSKLCTDISIVIPGMILISGYKYTSPEQIHILFTLKENPTIHPNITSTANDFTEMADVSYPLYDYSLAINSVLTYSWESQSDIDGDLTEIVVAAEEYSTDTIFYYDAYYNYSLPQSSSLVLDIDIACSISGLYTIVYEIVANGDDEIPSWVTLDDVNSQLVATTPALAEDTYFSFQIKTTSVNISATTYQEFYLMVVVSGEVEHCSQGQYGYNYNCSVGAEDYELNLEDSSGTAIFIEYTSPLSDKSVLTAMKSLIAGAGLLSLPSPQSIWMMMNQYQLFIALLLSGAYIPKEIADYFVGMDFAFFSFNFLRAENWYILSNLVKSTDYEQTDEKLKFIGLDSGSAVVNNISLIGMICIIIVAHFLLLIMYVICKSEGNHNLLSFKIISYFLKLFTFSVYIRLIMQAYEILLISALSEIKNVIEKEKTLTISFLGAVIITFVCIGFIIFNIGYYYKYHHYKLNNGKFSEFMDGLKQNKGSRVYTSVLHLRKFYLMSWIILWPPEYYIGIEFKMVMMSLPQALYVMYIISVRPLKHIVDNIISCITEISFTFCAGMLIYYNSTDRWNKKIQSLYLLIVMTVSGTLVTIVVAASFSIKIGSKGGKRGRSARKIANRKSMVINSNIGPLNENNRDRSFQREVTHFAEESKLSNSNVRMNYKLRHAKVKKNL